MQNLLSSRSSWLGIVLVGALACSGSDGRALSADASDPIEQPPPPDAAALPDAPHVCAAEQAPFPLLVSGNVTIAEGLWSLHGERLGGLSAVSFSAPFRPGYVPVASVGDCTLYKPESNADICASCPGGCDATGLCPVGPQAFNIGTIEVTSKTKSFEFPWAGVGYEFPSTEINYFEPGECLTVRSETGPELEVMGVPELDYVAAALSLSDNSDTVLHWTPEQMGRIQLWIEVGTLPDLGPLLLCEQEDTGTLTIPKELIKKLPFLHDSLASPQNRAIGRLSRFFRATKPYAGSVFEFFVASSVSFAVSHSISID